MSIVDDPQWQAASEAFNQAMEEYQKEADDLWNSLPYNDRLKLFCAVSKLIHKGEIQDRKSYRGILYDTFEFESDAYAAAQCAGYLEIHNAIYDGESISKTVKDFVENYMDITNDNLQGQIDKFIAKRHL